MKPATECVQAGEKRTVAGRALATPIAQTATFTFESTAEIRDFFEGRLEREEYGRYGNPTTAVVEKKLAALEGAEDACLFASGMAAETAVLLAFTRSGDHVVYFDDCYRRTRQLLSQVLARYGVASTAVRAGDVDAMRTALLPHTRVVLSESPTNPYLRVLDLERAAQALSGTGAKLVVDATLATPVNQRPLSQGAHLVVHSATKYLAGHNDVLGGVVAGSSGRVSLVREVRDVTGAILDPHAAYLVLRGLKTLSLRVAAQNAAALRIAGWLESHPKVARVFHPGLASHPDHDVAARLMSGFGGVVSFEVRGGGEKAARVVDSVRLARVAPSFGGVETLIEQPALMSYFDLGPEGRKAIGISEGLLRLAVGVEDEGDLIADLEQALEK